MRKKRITISLVLLVFLLVFAGCGGVSKKQEAEAREWIDKMIIAADGAIVTRADCTTDFEAELTYPGGGKKCWFAKIEARNMYDKESGRTDSEVTIYGDDEPFKARVHMNEEMGVFYIYAKRDKYDWIKYDACFLKEDMSRNFVSGMNLENAEIVDFIKDYKKVNEKNTHKVSVKLKDASIRELLFESGFKILFWANEYNSVDLNDVNVRLDYYVDPETAQVVELEAQLEGMENFLRKYKCLYEKADYEDFEESKINKGKLIYKNIGYEDVKVPMLGFEDKKNSSLIYQQDSIYTLKTMDAEAEAVCPKGWYIHEKDTHKLTLIKVNDGIVVTYRLHMPFDYKDFKKQLNDQIEAFKTEGTYISDKEGPKTGDFETLEILTTKGRYISAYTTVNQTMLEVMVEDYSGNDNDTEISEILEKVKLKAIEF